MENQVVRYSVPIQVESIEGGVRVKGVAVDESTSRNGITYIASELHRAAKSLKGKPMGVDHSGNVEDIVGRVEKATSVNQGKQVLYEAVIKDTEKHKGIVKMIREGLIQSVSIEAIFKKIVREKDKFIAKGIEFVGLDLVKTPGVANATVALAESFESIVKNNLSHNKTNMNLVLQLAENLLSRKKITEEDVKNLRAMYESLPEDDKADVEDKVEEVEQKAEDDAAAAGDGDGDGDGDDEAKEAAAKAAKENLALKERVALLEQDGKATAKANEVTAKENKTLSEKIKKQELSEEAEEFIIKEGADGKTVGLLEAKKQDLVDFMFTLSDTQLETFKSLIQEMKKVDFPELGSGESVEEKDGEAKAKKLAVEIKAADPSLESWEALDKAYEQLGMK